MTRHGTGTGPKAGPAAGAPARPGPAALTAAIDEALARQRAYEQARATRLGRGAERLTRPLGAALGRLIPAEMVRRALAAADAAATLTLPAELTRHDADDIAACEAAALRAQAWAQGGGAAAGGVAGWLGPAGLALDLPATIALAARTVRATAAAYGFPGDDEAERAFRLAVLELAASIAEEERGRRIARINAMARTLASPEARAATEWLVDKLAERVARQLGLSLAARKTGQVVPILGGIVAAAVNASYQADVARAARYAYRQRWLIARRALPAHPQPATEVEP
ncbi:MAG: EcsC family protein [Alphaproteobacteria bacterium]|nr:MAG: EcsC family protein [Alphaproteobacteria bacterium]